MSPPAPWYESLPTSSLSNAIKSDTFLSLKFYAYIMLSNPQNVDERLSILAEETNSS